MKALYSPKGKAGEYALFACNFFNGCSNDCEYCYCKRGILSHVWSNKPHLKKCFRNERHALEVFNKELDSILVSHPEIKKHGILFSFTTDPLLPETRFLTYKAAQSAGDKGVPVQILTKRADFVDDVKFWWFDTSLTAFGFTLTGVDCQEPGASLNSERIEAMRELHDFGYKTFASIEPVIDPALSLNMINATKDFCDVYKVGLISGKGKDFYDGCHMSVFWNRLIDLSESGCKIYPKDSLLNYMLEDRSSLEGNFINTDYNIFNS